MADSDGVGSGGEEVGPSTAAEAERVGFPLTPLQEGMLFHHLSEPGSDVDLEQILCKLRHPVDAARLQAAWTHAAERHPRLGAFMKWSGLAAPTQFESPIEPVLNVEDLSGMKPGDREPLVTAFLAQDRRRGFDPGQPPLFRLTLLRLDDADHRLVWTFPHILMDGRSFPIVLRTVFDHYDGISPSPGPDVETSPPFREFVEWARSRDDSGDEAFWTGHLAGFRTPVSALPRPGQDGSGVRVPGDRRESSIALEHGVTLALRARAREAGVRLHTLVHGAWAMALGCHAEADDVVFGSVNSGRSAPVRGVRDMVGVLINALPVRVHLDPKRSMREWLGELEERERACRPFEQTPLVRIQQWSEVPAGIPLFESLIVYDHTSLGTQIRSQDRRVDSDVEDPGARWTDRDFELLERAPYPLTLYAYGEDCLLLKLAHDGNRMGESAAGRLLGHVAQLLRQMAADPEARLGDLEILTPDERTRLVEEWNRTALPVPTDVTLHGLVLRNLRARPERVAVVCGRATISAGELDALAGRIAGHLRALGIGGGDRVGVALPRSIDLVATLLGILQTGAAYVPLDPDYPQDRLDFMVRDAGLRALVATRATGCSTAGPGVIEILLDRDREAILGASEAAVREAESAGAMIDPAELAYVIHTSGSTGRPKGVAVEHRNVVNLLFAMDRVLGVDSEPAESEEPVGAWLSTTSLSFDISVLEIFWPLARGLRLVLHQEDAGPVQRPDHPFILGDDASNEAPMEFSLFYFASDAGQDAGARYRLLLEGAEFADAQGFSAVWMPERHFHPFGGLYPNPAVTGAAVAAVTRRVGIRAGSVVLSLHHPVRVAEEWAVVDNLSGGRVGVSIASGWHPEDFLLAPGNHADRKEVMLRNADTIRRLWRGEKVAFAGPDGRPIEVGVLPRPLQPELPLWLTTAGSVESYREAGRIGARVLTHLLGQTPEELEARIQVYRRAWTEAGHEPGGSHVSLMLHAFVGESDDAVRETVREPMKAYLRSSVGLIRNFASSWTAYRGTAGAKPAAHGDEFSRLSEEDLDGLLEFAFNRYFETSGLFGSHGRCVKKARELHAIGVDEIACLIDFGVETEQVLHHLPLLSRVHQEVAGGSTGQARRASGRSVPLSDVLQAERVTHLQCTPSQLRLLLADSGTRTALRGLPLVLVGGEALPAPLARELRKLTGGRVLNMYGPTETTIWSTSFEVGDSDVSGDGVVPLGRPIANTSLYVLDPSLRPVPVGVPGELFIAGRGVARGYLGHPELSAERFLPDPLAAPDGSTNGAAREAPRMYRTGDRVRYREDGVLEFLGRTDLQVKVRGHRIELGEIESAIRAHPGIADCAVVLREDTPGDQRLFAYLVASDPSREPDRLRAEVRAALIDTLPPIMVPSSLFLLDRLPLTPNRKVDRKALPLPAMPKPSPGPATPPRPTLSDRGSEPPRWLVDRVASIWKELLGLDAIGLDENFFDLGGHSLLTVQVHMRIREDFDLDVRITDLFRFPTVRSLARHLAHEDRMGVSDGPLSSALVRGALRRQALTRRVREP